MQDVRKHGFSAAKVFAALIVATVLMSGCAALDKFAFSGRQPEPLTPEQSKGQVIEAAHDIADITHLDVVRAVFWRSSCNDQGEPPYRSELLISRPLAGSFEAADAEDAALIEQLRRYGWQPSDFLTHGTPLEKNGVYAVVGPQNAATPTRSLHLYGECRDFSSAKGTSSMEDINLTTA